MLPGCRQHNHAATDEARCIGTNTRIEVQHVASKECRRLRVIGDRQRGPGGCFAAVHDMAEVGAAPTFPSTVTGGSRAARDGRCAKFVEPRVPTRRRSDPRRLDP